MGGGLTFLGGVMSNNTCFCVLFDDGTCAWFVDIQ